MDAGFSRWANEQSPCKNVCCICSDIWIRSLENGEVPYVNSRQNGFASALTKTVGVFPKDRAIVDRERSKGSYSLGPYLLSKIIDEIPIGAAFPLMSVVVLYPMARLNPTLSRFGKFCGIVTVESFVASAIGQTVGEMVPSTEAAMAV